MHDLAIVMSFLATLGASTPSDGIDSQEILCLADNIYYEARGEDWQGQVAIAHVTRNRRLRADYPDTYCGVVHQPAQFSWTLRNVTPKRNRDAWRTAVEVAAAVMTGLVPDNTAGATHFYNPKKASPGWRQALDRVKRIGNHLFFRDG